MKTAENKNIGLLVAASAAALGAAGLFAVWPGHAARTETAPFRGRYLAHRGLHGEGVAENTVSAVSAGAEKLYGAMLDVRVTADGQAVVFHDADAFRMTGIHVSVEQLALEEAQTLLLRGTDETVPTLREALAPLRKANVPVIVHILPTKNYKAACRAVLSVLDEKSGSYCVESEDVRVLAWFRRHARELPRSLRLSADGKTVRERLASAMLLNFIARPGFFDVEGEGGFAVTLMRALGAFRISRVRHDRSGEAKNDVLVFEGFLPPAKFR